MSNFFKFLFVGATAVTLVIPGSLLEAARAKKQTPQNSGVKAVPSRRANVPMRQIKRLLASPQPDNENWNTQVKQSIALLKASKPAQADAFEQRYLAITTKGKAPVTIAPEVIVEAEVETVEIKEETVPEFQQQVQKIAQAANLTGDDLTKFQAFADTMQNIKNIEQEFKDKGFDMENPSDWQTAREKEPELWDRYSKAQGAMFGAFFALAEKFKTDEDFAKMSTLQTYANFAGAARDVIANLDAAKARSVVEKTKEMMNAYKPYYQLLGTAETIQKVPDTQALDALLK